MYIPASFKETRAERLHGLIERHPLGLLISYAEAGLEATPIPFLLYPDEGKHGVLRAHMARANPHWKLLAEQAECLVVFQGADGYVTPSWYPSKAEAHQVVPTWNYVVVQAWGRPVVCEDAAWLRRQLDDLTRSQEKSRLLPWSVADAPADYLANLMKAIVGIEIPISRMEGKWKLSQNKSDFDRAGVIEGLRSEADPHRNIQVADLMSRS